ncbi:tigger transposable element-derived protein 1-like [Portunus trituberculatus]|uniref:tigger transposable element-derived protein 1-like n=1 Tax=Portunus trituberculatus TaxID=210409 RepID=UPI001E1CDA58|nr:tigger transposable element-derived protein 1-like [Portunus trituberculatus]
MPKPHAGKCKSLDFSIKQEVVKRKEEGQGNSAIGRALGHSESTVRTVWKKKDEIKASVKAYGTSQIDNHKRAWDEKLIKMERFFALWIERKEKEGSSVDKRQIKQQAKCFYEVICRKTNVPVGNFHASNGCLHRFLKRKEIRKLGYSGETASADANAAKEFPSVLKEIIDEGKFHLDCIYNMDEAGLMYKMPPKSIWKCEQLGIPFNVMLIMDNCPAHPHYLTDLHPNVKIVFLPPKTTSIVQPLDQEFIGNVKSIYQKLVYEDLRLKTECGAEIHQIIAEANGEYQDADIDVDEHLPLEVEETDQLVIQQYTNPKAISVHHYWREFTVRNAIDFLLKAWDEISMPTVRHAWRPLVPHLVSDEHGKVQTLMEAAAVACRVPGFQNVTPDEIKEMNIAGDIMTPEVIMDVATIEDVLGNENQGKAVEAPPPGELIMQQLSRILAGVDTFKDQQGLYRQPDTGCHHRAAGTGRS